jgi:hypothetical protein
MSDVNVAPAPAPAAPAAPAANEVVINPNQTTAPQPVGSQAPDKPVGDIKGSEHRPQSRREAIQAAFEKARKENPPKAAEARKGHNNPPEDTPDEKINLKKRPADQPQRERGEHGHFARRETPAGADTGRTVGAGPQARQQPGAQQPGAQQQRLGAQLPETARYREPPKRMTDHAKAEWGATPESVRGDVYRMQQEFEGAYRHYKRDYETMNTIRPFDEMARQHGTTLQRALSNYVTMEQKLRADPVGGLDIIVSNLNLQTPDGRKITLADIAHHVLSRTPEQHRLMQHQNAQTAQSQQIGQLHQMVSTLANGFQQMQYNQQFSHTRSALDQFADAHPRFDELAEDIEREVKLGFDLETAYKRAELLRPATRAAQTRNGNGNGTAAQTRTADRSIHGAPEAGSMNGAAQRGKGKQVGRRDAIANAIKRVSGSL